jgi:hypothetical protein
MTDQLRLKGVHYTHLPLWETATRFLAAGKAEEKGSFYSFLAATLFSYHAFEALLNAWLHALDPEGWAREKEIGSTLAKCAHLFALAGIPLDKSRRPYQTVREVAGARDFLAHAKMEHFDEIIPASQLNEMVPIEPEINRFGSEAFATEALSQIEALANTLNQGLRAKFHYVPVGSAGGAFYGISGSSEASLPEVQ